MECPKGDVGKGGWKYGYRQAERRLVAALRAKDQLDNAKDLDMRGVWKSAVKVYLIPEGSGTVLSWVQE